MLSPSSNSSSSASSSPNSSPSKGLQKVALLLHTGGADFQELYYTLVPENEEKSLKKSFEVLYDYFIPKATVPFERHLFRQMSQVTGGKVDQFVSRLRQNKGPAY